MHGNVVPRRESSAISSFLTWEIEDMLIHTTRSALGNSSMWIETQWCKNNSTKFYNWDFGTSATWTEVRLLKLLIPVWGSTSRRTLLLRFRLRGYKRRVETRTKFRLWQWQCPCKEILFFDPTFAIVQREQNRQRSLIISFVLSLVAARDMLYFVLTGTAAKKEPSCSGTNGCDRKEPTHCIVNRTALGTWQVVVHGAFPTL